MVLRQDQQTRRQNTEGGESSSTAFDFLRQDYKDGLYYFECVFLIEKLMLTGRGRAVIYRTPLFIPIEYRLSSQTDTVALPTCVTGRIIFVDPGTIFQAVCGTCIAFTFCLIEVIAWPYSNKQDNVLKTVGEIQLFVTLLLTIVLQSTDDALAWDTLDGRQYDVILAISFFVTPLLYIFFSGTTLCRCCRRLYQKRKGSRSVVVDEQLRHEEIAPREAGEESDENDGAATIPTDSGRGVCPAISRDETVGNP